MATLSCGPPRADPFLGKLERAFARLPAAVPRGGRVAVAFSGGIDSTVLLAALHRLGFGERLRAVHVDHGLQPASAQWAAQCRATAARLGVPIDVLRVAVDGASGQGIEAAAREARYAALAAAVAPGEVLVTAHHADDQLETVLLRMLRGTGVDGLAAIVETSALGAGWLFRPMLDHSRAEVEDAAGLWGLAWVDDPSNASLDRDRNYLRHVVVPRLDERWPAARRTAGRLARHMADARTLLAELAAIDASGYASAPAIPLEVLRDRSPARRRNLLRHLIAVRGLPAPDASQLAGLEAALDVERRDAHTAVRWKGAVARVYAGRLYVGADDDTGTPATGTLAVGRPFTGAPGTLELEPTTGPGLPDDWARAGLDVRFRRGGERFRPLGQAHRRALKQCLQEARIVPWMRARIPLLYREGVLVAVADLWLADEVRDDADAGARWRVVWKDRPAIH